jgi:death-on-curing protein
MAGSSRYVVFLTIEQVIEINLRMVRDPDIEGFYGGGADNVKDRAGVGYIVGAIQDTYFDHDLYPTIVEKAAALAFHYATHQCFHDGNKRTGIGACSTFLEANGYQMGLQFHEDVADTIVKVAEKKMTFEEFTKWLDQRISLIEPPTVVTLIDSSAAVDKPKMG